MSISHRRGYRQLSLLPGTHVQQALIPAIDDLSHTEGKGDGLAALVGFIEYSAGGEEGAAVIDADGVPSLRWTGTFDWCLCFDEKVFGADEGEKDGEDGGGEERR